MTPIDQNLLTAAADAGAKAAAEIFAVCAPEKTLLSIADYSDRYALDRQAREAFAAAVIKHVRIDMANKKQVIVDYSDLPDETKEKVDETHAMHAEIAKLRLQRDELQDQLDERKRVVQSFLDSNQRLESAVYPMQMELAECIAERDEAKTLFSNLAAQLENVVSKTGWRQVKNQKPTLEDADADGDVITCNSDGEYRIRGVLTFNVADVDELWWRPAMLPVKVPDFVLWKRTLSHSEREDAIRGDLEVIWNSIQKFNQSANKNER